MPPVRHEAAEPPLRLPRGSGGEALVEDKLTSVASELSQWRALALSTGFSRSRDRRS